MEMDWVSIQTAQLAAASANRAAQKADADRAPQGDSFRTVMDQKQSETAGQTGQAEQEPQDGQAHAPEEVSLQQRALAAALAIQAAIVPVETPADIQQPVEQPVAVAQAVEVTAGVTHAVQQQPEPAVETRPQTARQPEAVPVEGEAKPAAVPEESAEKSAPVVRSEETQRSQPAVQSTGQERPEAGTKPSTQTGEETAQAQTQSEFGYLFRRSGDYVVKVGERPVVDTQSTDVESQLAKQVVQAQEKGVERVEIQLEPENLGTLVLTLDRSRDGALHVTLHAASEKTAGLLGEHVDGLSALLQGGVQSQQVVVEVQRQQESQQAQYQQNQQQYQEQGQGQGGQQGRQPQQEHRQNQQAQDFIQQLRLGLVSLDGEAS